MAKYDLFYASNDSTVEKVENFSISPSAGFTSGHGNNVITVASGSYGYLLNKWANLNEAGNTVVYGKITDTTSTTITFRPWESEAGPRNNAVQTWTTAATIKDAAAPQCTLSIDLTEAPEDNYTYLILASACIAAEDAGDIPFVLLTSNNKPCDHYSSDNGSFTKNRNLAIFTAQDGNHTFDGGDQKDKECYTWNCSHLINPTAGELLEFNIQATTSLGTAYLSNSHIIAVRVPSTTLEDDEGTTASAYTEAAGTYTDTVSVTTTQAGAHAVFCTGSVSASVAGDPVSLKVLADGVTLSEVAINPPTTSDRIPFGFALNTAVLSISDVIKLQIKGDGTHTATLHSPNLVAFEIVGHPDLGIDGSSEFVDVSTSEEDGSDVTGWAELDSSTTFSPSLDRRHLEIIGGTFYKSAGDTEIMVRPFFEGGVDVGRTSRGKLFNTLTNCCFWLNLSDQYRNNSGQSLSIEAKAGTDDSNVVKGKYLTYMSLPERERVIPTEADKVSVIADVESGLYVKRWDSGSDTDVFQKRLVDILRISRVLRNGTAMTKLTSSPTWSGESEDSFYWDVSSNLIEIKMPSGKNPNNDDQVVVVVALDTYGRVHEMLYEEDDDGNPEYYSFDPLIVDVPSVKQDLQVRSSEQTVATTVGNLRLSSANQEIDSEILRRIYEGFDVKIRKGYSGRSENLADFETISIGTMGIPRLEDDSVNIRVFDAGINLQNAISERSISVYQGSTLLTNHVLPVVFGPVKRVPAVRVTNNEGATGTTNDFKICGHALSSITAVYANGSDTDALVTTGGGLYPKSGLIRLDVDDEDANGGDNADGTYRSDTVYCDVVGLQFKVDNSDQPDDGIVDIAWPGEMMKHIVQSYPREENDTTTGIHQWTNTLTHTPNLSAGNTITGIGTADVAKLSVGDILKFDNSTQVYHAVITKIVSTTSIHVHLQEFTGDDSSVSYNTSSTVTLVEKAGGYPNNRVDHDSFWRLDHFPHNIRGRLNSGSIEPPPPVIGHLFEGSTTVAEALDQVAAHSFTYWYVNRSGRVAAGAPDFEYGQLLLNPGYEDNDNSAFGWYALNALDGLSEHGNNAISSTKKFEGLYAVQHDNSFGSFSKNPAVVLSQPITLPRPGMYCFTCVIGQVTGDFNTVRISVTDPADTKRYFVSEPVEISSNRWTRASVLFETGDGISGTAVVRVHPVYPEVGESPPTFDNANLIDWFCAEFPGSGWDPGEDAAEVTTWYNKGTSGNNLVQQSTSAPRIKKNTLHGMPSLEIDGEQSTERLAYIDTLTAPLTISFVSSVREDITGAFNSVWRGVSSGDDVIIGIRNGKFGAWAGAEIVGEDVTDNTNSPKIFTVTLDGTDAEFFINGVSQGTTTWNDTITSVVVGTGTNTFVGNIFEIAVYDEFLDTSSRGQLESYLMKKYGIGESTILVDNAEVYPVGASLSDSDTMYDGIEFRDEIFSESSVSYNYNPNDSEFTKKVIVSDSEAEGLTTSISQGRSAIRSTSRLVQDEVSAEDAASATGVAASQVNYYGRQRFFAELETELRGRIPKIGEKIFTGNFDRLTKDSTGYPLLSMTSFEHNASNAKILTMEGEGRLDPQYDRDELTGAEIPVGAIVMTTSGSTPTDYEEINGMKGWFVIGADFGNGQDAFGQFGGTFGHTHDLDHTHALAGHTHTGSVLSVGDIQTSFWALQSQGFVGPLAAQAEGVGESNDHNHSVGASNPTKTSSSNGGESGAASTTLTSNYGDVIPTHIRVRFLRRTQNTVTAIPTGIILGYEKNSTPSNWSRTTALDGYYIRGATANAAFSGRAVTSAFTQAAAGFTLQMSTWSGIYIGSTLTITEASNTLHVVALWPNPSTNEWWVYPVHSTGDSADGTSYTTSAVVALGNNSSGVAETVGTTYTQLNHDHGNVVGSHTHTAPHTHTMNMNHVTGQPLTTFNTTPNDEPIPSAGSEHVHVVGTLDMPTDSTTSGSASGSTISDVAHEPGAYNMVFMNPDGTVSELPSGAIIFWAGSEPPPGYSRVEAADGLLLRGADAGLDGSADDSTHTHTFTAAAHTLSHNHGGSFVDESEYSSPAGNTKYWLGTSGDTTFAADRDHTHNVTVGSVSTTDPTLLSRTATTGNSDQAEDRPYFAKLMLCKRG